MKGTDLYLALWRGWHAVAEADRASIAAAGFGVPTDFAVLELLWHKGRQTVGALGKAVLLTSGSITTAVDRLEREGLVSRTRSASDGRVVEVELTEAGRSRIEQAFPGHTTRLNAVFDGLSRQERRDLVAMMRRVRKRAESLLVDAAEA